MKKYNIKFRKGEVIVIAISVLILAAVAIFSINENNRVKRIKRIIEEKSKSEEHMTENRAILKIKDACVIDNVGKEISVVGFMGGTMADDGSMAWLTEKPFMSSSQFLDTNENVICLEPKSGETFEYNELSVAVTGTLKHNSEANKWYLVDASIEEYASQVTDRLIEFNMLVSSGYCDIIEGLAGEVYDKLNFDSIESDNNSNEINLEELESIIEFIAEYKDFEYTGSAYNIACELRGLIAKINDLIESKNIDENVTSLNAEANEVYAAFYSFVVEAGKDIVY